MAQPFKNPPAMQEPQVPSLGQEDSLKWQPTPGSLPENPMKSQPTPGSLPETAMDRTAWQAAVHGVAEIWARLSSGALSTSVLTALLCPLVMVSPSLLHPFQDGAPFPHSWTSIMNSLRISQ